MEQKTVLLIMVIWQIFFKIKWGVKQGCPLSAYLFIIVIEILSACISKNQNIKGLKIGKTEVKSTLVADDATFITDGSRKSFNTLFNVLDDFEKISGLRLNNSKCNVLKAGSLKSMTDVRGMSIKYVDFSHDSEFR